MKALTRNAALAVAAATLSAAVLTAPALAAIPSGNIVTNPSFETSTAGWYGDQATLTREANADAPDGDYVARLAAGSGSTYEMGDTSAVVQAAPQGTSYAIAARVSKGAESTVGDLVRLGVREIGPAGVVREVVSPVQGMGSAFKSFSLSVTPATGNALAVFVRAESGVTSTDSILIDQVTVVPSGSAGTTPTPTPTTPPTTEPTTPPTTQPTTPPTTVPTTPPTTPPTTTPTVSVSTAAQLDTALDNATPGTVIQLADGTYSGKFVGAANGTASKPITLQGSRKAILTTGSLSSGYGLQITGDYWKLNGFAVKTAAKGIVLDRSSYTVIDGVEVANIANEGVHFRTSSDHGTIQNSYIHNTGADGKSYGEGIYLGSAVSNWETYMGSSTTPDASSYGVARNNTLTDIPGEAIDIKEGTVSGVIEGNTMTRTGTSGVNNADSAVDVKGKNYTIRNNTVATSRLDAFQVHELASGYGVGNIFSGNTVSGIPGYEVRDDSSNTNTVMCKASNAALGLTNVSCTP
jgi:hypothetical protein